MRVEDINGALASDQGWTIFKMFASLWTDVPTAP